MSHNIASGLYVWPLSMQFSATRNSHYGLSVCQLSLRQTLESHLV